jgi:hypothetical protein
VVTAASISLARSGDLVKKLILRLLLIPIFYAAVGTAYSADAPDGTIRIAAISALPATALPKAPTRAVADIAWRPSTAATAAPHVTARHAPVSRQNATATATVPVRGILDLRPPDLRSMPWTDSLLAGVPADSDEQPAIAVVTAVLLPDKKSDTSLSLAGVGSLYWAARHPARAWKILLPMQAGDDFGTYVDITTKCAVLPSAPGGRTACP